MIDFMETCQRWRDGALIEESNEVFQRLIKDCCDTDKAGEISIKFKIEPERSRDGGVLIKMTPKVESKNPKYDPGVGMFHVVTDDSGQPVGLEREDPRQTQLFEQMRGERREVTE